MGQKRDREIVRIARSRYWREAEARAVIRSWQRSGEPLCGFARGYGLKPRRIARWVSQLDGAAATEVRFHPIRLVDSEQGRQAASGREAIEVVLENGRRVRVPEGFTAEGLRRVLTVVEDRARC